MYAIGQLVIQSLLTAIYVTMTAAILANSDALRDVAIRAFDYTYAVFSINGSACLFLTRFVLEASAWLPFPQVSKTN